MELDDFFQPVADINPKARVAITGPAGVGKTFSAIRLANGLADDGNGGLLGPIVVIDTEGNSAAKYRSMAPTLRSARPAQFAKVVKGADRIPLVENDPRLFIAGINAASTAAVIIVDSITHAWEGTKAIVDAAGDRERARAKEAGRSANPNTFALWKDAAPMWAALMDTIMNSPAHVIVTMRSKKHYVIEEGRNGRSAPRVVGMQPEAREGTDHTFDIVLDMTPDHIAEVSKTRMSALDGRQIDRPDEELGREIRAWLDSVAYTPPHIARLLELAKARGAYGTGDKQINESKIRDWDTPTIMKAIARLESVE